MSTTQENLMAAFAGESQANRKYLAFAKQADKEGLPQVAKLFRAAAEAETVHAHTHLQALKGVAGTAEKLVDQSASASEPHDLASEFAKLTTPLERAKFVSQNKKALLAELK